MVSIFSFVFITKNIRDAGTKKPPNQISPCNLGISPKNFLTFSLTLFLHLLNLIQEHISKNCFLWSNSYKIEAMITYHIEILELPNFGGMTTSAI